MIITPSLHDDGGGRRDSPVSSPALIFLELDRERTVAPSSITVSRCGSLPRNISRKYCVNFDIPRNFPVLCTTVVVVYMNLTL